MSKLTIIDRFGITPNNVLNNKDLTFKAKWLFWYIQSKPDNWDFAVNRICQDWKDWKDWISSWLAELENLWYLIRKRFKNNKWQWDVEYILYSESINTITENPVTENPVTENPVTENPQTNKDRITNKEIIIKKALYPQVNDLLYFQEGFEYIEAKIFFNAHINNKTPSILYKLKSKNEKEIIQIFANSVNKLKRIDGFSEKEITFIISFITCDSKINNPWKNFYWLDQIQTIDKLRSKNREWIPYFIVLIDPAKKHYINNLYTWVTAVT